MSFQVTLLNDSSTSVFSCTSVIATNGKNTEKTSLKRREWPTAELALRFKLRSHQSVSGFDQPGTLIRKRHGRDTWATSFTIHRSAIHWKINQECALFACERSFSPNGPSCCSRGFVFVSAQLCPGSIFTSLYGSRSTLMAVEVFAGHSLCSILYLCRPSLSCEALSAVRFCGFAIWRRVHTDGASGMSRFSLESMFGCDLWSCCVSGAAQFECCESRGDTEFARKFRVQAVWTLVRLSRRLNPSGIRL